MHTQRNIILISVAAVVVLTALLLWNPKDEESVYEGEPIVLYCAAGMKIPMEEIIEAYEKEYGVHVQANYEGSGTLLTKLKVLPKGDLYLAADESYIHKARQEGLVDESIPLTHIRPILAVPKGNPKGIKTIADLLRSDIKIALAEPDAAAIGKSTKRLLNDAGQWDAISKNTTVFTPTVTEIANAVKLGSVDVGIIWDAVCNMYPELEAVTDPTLDAGSMLVTIGVLSNTKQPTQTLKFARYAAARDRGLLEFEKNGFDVVKGDIWEEHPDLVFFSGGVNRLAIESTLKRFERREGVTIKVTYNGCGILVSEMKAGARPDGYFACDVSFSNQVKDIFDDFEDISETDMVMLVKKDNPENIKSIEDLTREGLKLGVANAEQSALGALTQNLLQEAGLLQDVMKNVVVQSPTADVLVNQLQAGHQLDAVIVYEANCFFVRDKLTILHIDHPAAHAIQPISTLKNSDHRYTMARLIEAIRSAESQNRFTELGFRWRAGQVQR